jgi:hypothetical protein
VHGIERHLLYVSLTLGMDHPRSVEPPPRNVQQCNTQVDDNEEGDRAPSTGIDTRSMMAGKHLVTPENSKKRPRSSQTIGVPENSTSKHRRMIQSWSDEDEEENPTANLLIPRQRKGVEQTSQEGPSKPTTAPSVGMPTASTVATSHVPPPSEGGRSSSG